MPVDVRRAALNDSSELAKLKRKMSRKMIILGNRVKFCQCSAQIISSFVTFVVFVLLGRSCPPYKSY